MAGSAATIGEYPRTVRWGAGVLLALGLVLAGAVVAMWGGWSSLAAPGLVGLLAIGFWCAERFPVSVQVRSQAVEVSASEFLLVVGFFLLSPIGLLVARVVGGIPYRVRSDWTKNLVNTGLMLVTTSAMIVVVHGVDTPDLGRPFAWSVVLAAVALGSLIDAGVLSIVVRAATRGRSRLGPEVALAMVVWALVTASVSLSGLLLSTIDAAATLFAVVPAVVVLVGFRVLARQRDEAARLRGVHRAGMHFGEAAELDSLLAAVVTEAREVLGALEAEVHVLPRDGGPEDAGSGVVRADATGRIQFGERLDLPVAPAAATWRTLQEAGDGHVDEDHVVVPVEVGGQFIGRLVAVGRPRSRAPFTETDRTALRAMADRLGAVVGQQRLTADLHRATETRRYLETHDVLTRLGNRRWFVEEIGRLSRANTAVTVALLNLRGFRRVNEVHGQAAGDRLLVEVAEVLRRSLPSRASIARLAGDEFAVVLPGVAVDALARAVAKPVDVRVGGATSELAIAAGVSVWPRDVATPRELLRAADLALVMSRRRPAGGLVRYEGAFEETIARRSRLAADLRAGLAAGEVQVVFQPLVEVATGKPVGAEALARWRHSELGPIPPDEFIGVAEESGQVGALTRHVLDEAVRHAAAWRQLGLDLEIAVNVSTLDLEGGGLVDDVRRVLADHDLPASRLVLEVTESAMMADRTVADAVLADLAGLGVGLAIDDFGTGHSSLAYLANLPVTEVKVDRVFVDDLLHNQESELIVRAVVDIAARRNLVVVGEGVEDSKVLEALRRLGVHRCQGWHTGPPVPGDDFVRDLIAA